MSRLYESQRSLVVLVLLDPFSDVTETNSFSPLHRAGRVVKVSSAPDAPDLLLSFPSHSLKSSEIKTSTFSLLRVFRRKSTEEREADTQAAPRFSQLSLEEMKTSIQRSANQALQTTSVTRSGFGKVPVSDRQRRGV